MSPEQRTSSETSLFEDAKSEGIEAFVTELDSIVLDSENEGPAIIESPTITVTPTSVLSASELESSKRIRKKYGLEEKHLSIDNVPNSINYGIEDGLANGTAATTTASKSDNTRRRRDYEGEVSILFNTTQIIVRRFMEELASGGAVENEHPLLDPFLTVLELVLHHGWRGDGAIFTRRLTPWDIIQRVQNNHNRNPTRKGNNERLPPPHMAIENVKHFSSLKNGAARVRAWIRLALMDRSLTADLTLLISNEGAALSEYYNDWACVRSDMFQPLLALVSTLDAIDFNLFIKEEKISKGEFLIDWRRLFSNGRINFDRLNPPIHLSFDPLKTSSSPSSSSPPPPPPPPSSSLSLSKSPSMTSFSLGGNGRALNGGVEEELLFTRLSNLHEENDKLRRALVAQINQRAYFQDEYSKAQCRCATALQEQHVIEEQNSQLQRRIRELLALVETHEKTNEALQRQLAEAYSIDEAAAGGGGGGGGAASTAAVDRTALSRQRDAINVLSMELENERAAHKSLTLKIKDLQSTIDSTRLQSEAQIADLKHNLIESEEVWGDRVALLQEQLKLANSLKDEYKRRLKQ